MQIGPQGPKGDTGPAGSGSPDDIVRWDVVFTSNGAGAGADYRGTIVATSSEVIPKYSQMNPLDFQVTGDFSACTTDMQVSVLQSDHYLASA